MLPRRTEELLLVAAIARPFLVETTPSSPPRITFFVLLLIFLFPFLSWLILWSYQLPVGLGLVFLGFFISRLACSPDNLLQSFSILGKALSCPKYCILRSNKIMAFFNRNPPQSSNSCQCIQQSLPSSYRKQIKFSGVSWGWREEKEKMNSTWWGPNCCEVTASRFKVSWGKFQWWMALEQRHPPKVGIINISGARPLVSHLASCNSITWGMEIADFVRASFSIF